MLARRHVRRHGGRPASRQVLAYNGGMQELFAIFAIPVAWGALACLCAFAAGACAGAVWGPRGLRAKRSSTGREASREERAMGAIVGLWVFTPCVGICACAAFVLAMAAASGHAGSVGSAVSALAMILSGVASVCLAFMALCGWSQFD